MGGWVAHHALHLVGVFAIFAYTNEQRLIRVLGEYARSSLVTVPDSELYRVTVGIRLHDFSGAFKLLRRISIEPAVPLCETTVPHSRASVS